MERKREMLALSMSYPLEPNRELYGNEHLCTYDEFSRNREEKLSLMNHGLI